MHDPAHVSYEHAAEIAMLRLIMGYKDDCKPKLVLRLSSKRIVPANGDRGKGFIQSITLGLVTIAGLEQSAAAGPRKIGRYVLSKPVRLGDEVSPSPASISGRGTLIRNGWPHFKDVFMLLQGLKHHSQVPS